MKFQLEDESNDRFEELAKALGYDDFATVRVGLHCDLFIFLTVWVLSVPLLGPVAFICYVNIVAAQAYNSDDSERKQGGPMSASQVIPIPDEPPSPHTYTAKAYAAQSPTSDIAAKSDSTGESKESKESKADSKSEAKSESKPETKAE